VLGREFEEAVLAEVAGEEDSVTLDAVHELIERRVLEPAAGTSLLRFVHDKLREGSYDRIVPQRRVALHARAAGAIERRHDGSPEISLHYNELANHWENAGDHERATDYYEKAAILSLRTGASRHAADFVQRIFALAPGTDRVRTAFRHRLLSAALFGLGDVAGSGREAAEGLRSVDLALPGTRAGWIRRFAASLTEQIVHLAAPRRLYRWPRAEWERLAEGAHAAQRLAESGFYANDALSMITCGLISVNLAERCGSIPNVARVYAMLGLIAGACGTHKTARRYFDEADSRAREAGDVAGQAFAHAAAAAYSVSIANWEAADHSSRESIRLSGITGDPQDMEMAVTLVGHVQFYTGRISDSRETYERVRDTARKRANLQHMSWGHMGVARSLIYEGRFDEALAEAKSALAAAQSDHMIRVISAAHAATALLHLNQYDAAREYADQAYTLVSESLPTLFEMARGYSAPCDVYLALWARAQRDGESSQELESQVFRLCRGLATLARRFPILRPTHARLMALAWAQRGSVRKAQRGLQRAAREASSLRMPVDAALAFLELSQLQSLARPDRRAYARRARQLLKNVGCQLYAERADDLFAARTTARRVAAL
jgi:tetratricopeptide (TPR) repeat protein